MLTVSKYNIRDFWTELDIYEESNLNWNKLKNKNYIERWRNF